MPQTIQQQRAAFAHQVVVEVAGQDMRARAKFRSLARSLPMMILANGLGQTLAMLEADEATAMLSAITGWLELRKHPCRFDALMQADQESYFIAQSEALKIAEWIKIIATALIPPPQRGDTQDSVQTEDIAQPPAP